MYKKELFYNTLKDVFIGAKIEGNSGYVNMMRIKNKYYEKLKPELQKTIDSKFAHLGHHAEEEMYNKLYTFFSKYFSESGSIYFTQTALPDKVYERIYEAEKDVALFWKTNMLYYIKTERLFTNIVINFEKNNFHFDVTNLEHKKNNEKKELLFEITNAERIEIEKQHEYHFYLQVSYAKNGAKTKIDEMPKFVRKNYPQIFVNEDVFQKAITLFKKQSEVDYFINKNAKQFLKEQFAHYIKGYFLDDETIFEHQKLHQMKDLQHVAYKIIDVISQFEDELVKVWNKPKFAHSANYVITADKIAKKNTELLQQIFTHKNINLQIAEWKELGIINNDELEITNYENFIANVAADFSLQKNNTIKNTDYRLKSVATDFLPIDTKYFKDLELQILALFEDLEAEIDGWLIHSENYQALNTLKHKFKEKIQTIYIDPPYNTKNDEFMYKDAYKHSSWLTLMENRLELARKFMTQKATIFTSIDDNEQAYFKILCDNLFGENNFIANMIRQNKVGSGHDTSMLAIEYDYILAYCKDKEAIYFNQEEIDVEGDIKYKLEDEYLAERGRFHPRDLDYKGSYSKSLDYPITTPDGTEIYAGGKYGEPNTWRWSKDKFQWGVENGFILFKKNNNQWKVYLKQYQYVDNKGLLTVRKLPYRALTKFLNGTGSQELSNIMGSNDAFSFPKSVELVSYIINISNGDNSTILDFFGGSGTTAHATIELNKKDEGKRKYLLVELGSHFDTVIIPRLKKISFSDKWKDGKAQENGKGVSQFFKYFSLEQYEETLQKSKYIDTTNILPDSRVYQEYLFLKDLKLADGVVNIDDKEEKITVDLTALHPDIDIAETLSQLTGKFIKQITAEEVVFADGSSMNFKNLDYKVIKPLIWW